MRKIYKARCFPWCSFLEAQGGGDLSYAWASLRGAKSILLEGLRWRVGNGQTIKVWRDDWNPKKEGLFVPKESTLEDSGLRVADLIDS